MGATTSKFINEIGSIVGGAVAAPFKSIFGRSCENDCGGVWDVVCFVEHICILDLVKFVLACCMAYICLVFLYLFFKLGICQCIARGLCNMCWTACETYWFTLDYICCYCWHKIRYTKRVYRGRHRLRRQLSRDVELGYITPYASAEENFFDDHGSNLARKRKTHREHTKRRTIRRRRTINRGSSLRLQRRQVSVHLKGRSRRSCRRRNHSRRIRRSTLGRSARNSIDKFKKSRPSISDDDPGEV